MAARTLADVLLDVVVESGIFGINHDDVIRNLVRRGIYELVKDELRNGGPLKPLILKAFNEYRYP